jgi:phosphatidylserine/phosphatidylglycerophosphate/cardiolipin synthase-like enzyme
MVARNYDTDGQCQMAQKWRIVDLYLEPVHLKVYGTPKEEEMKTLIIGNMANPSLCIDVKDRNTDSGNPLQLIPCERDERAQQFYYDSTTGIIRTVLDVTKCIEAGMNGETELLILQCTEGDEQKWIIKPDGRIQNIMHHKFCIIDLKTIVHGSYNWTTKAKWNRETISIENSRELAEKYATEFQQLIK